MGIFDRFPYSSTHEMNLDYMLGKATEIAEDMQTLTAGMEQVQAGLSAISEKTEQATEAAAQAAASASSIEGSVTAAEEAAEEAQMHNESAQTWANNALTYKADCQRAATEAAASSSSAAQAATAAAASEDTVATYAQAANASAQSAANNNDSAHQYANQASASASNATFHSSNAQTAATNAQTAATNANTSATNAAASADRAATLKTDVETLHRMCTTAVDQAAAQAVAAANSAAQAAATKTDVENLVESLPEDFTDLNNTVNQLSDEIDVVIYNQPYIAINPEDYELGTAWSSHGSISYGTGNNDSIRTKQNTSVSLKKGTIVVPVSAKIRLIDFATKETISNFVTNPVTIPATGNYVIVFATADGSAISNVSEILEKIFIVNPDGDDYKVISYEIQKANGTGAYSVNGALIDMKAQKFNAIKYNFNVTEDTQTGKTVQGMAIFNGIIFQGFGNGEISLIDISNGSVINTFSVSTGHCSSLSFSNEYYASGDEFPLLYVSSYIEPKTFAVRISRTECEIIKTYQLPTNKGGYLQQTSINKIDNTLWSIGHKNNSDSAGGAWIISHWDPANSVETNSMYEPELLDSFEMPFVKWLQCVQCYKGSLVVGVGSNLHATDEDMSRILFVDAGKKSIVSEIKDLPTDIKNPEIEGLDFAIDGDKYFIVLSLRSNPAYWKIEF